MADLNLTKALNLARTLTTIGHPYQETAIEATAFDLMKLCKGVFRGGRAISPEKQGEELVTAARTTWEDGWPDRGGTARLYKLARELFDPAKVEPAFRPFEVPLPPACEQCGDTGWESFERRGYTFSKLCTACGGKRKPSAVCPDCAGKETRLINGRREPCNTCTTPERRQAISEFFQQRRSVS